MGAIYLAQNMANGKVYVGQTVKASWRNRYRCSKAQVHVSQRLFHRAIKAHGREKFVFSDLMTTVPNSQLDYWERFWIASFGACDTSLGYNLDSGGRSQQTMHPSSNAKRSASMIGVNKGRKLPSWTADRHIAMGKQNHPMYRRIEWSHPVHGVFIGSASELKESYPDQGIVRQNLSKVANGTRPHCRGWTYLKDAKN